MVGRAAANWGGETPGFAVHIVEVEVDPETGKTQIPRYTALQDPGTAVHPSYVENQMQGGTVQGLEWAIIEECFFDDIGQMQNTSCLDYRKPVSADLPMVDTQLVDVPNPGHPTGVRGVGEVSIILPVPAVANAIHNVIGVRMNTLPMSPGAVLEALWEKG